jgi:hypothetical protein
MGGIVNKTSSAHSSSRDGARQQQVEPEISKNQFFRENSKILSSKRIGNIHPELRKLRLVLGCGYGRPKLVQYLTKTTQVQTLFENENNSSLHSLGSSFVFDHFIAKFHLSASVPLASTADRGPDNYSDGANLQTYAAQLMVLTAISGFHNFLSSPEYADWLRYQHLLSESRSGSNNNSSSPSQSLRSVSKLSSHRLATEIQNSDFEKLLNKSHWIVALAHVLEDLPYPVSLLGKSKEPPSGPSSSAAQQQSSRTQSSSSPTMVLFGNAAFVEMVGYTREEIAQHSYDHYYRSSSSCSETALDPEDALAISDAIHFGTSLKIGTICHPQAPLPPLLDLQSYLPLYDPDRRCRYILVLHCDIWKHREHSEYLERLDILTDMLSQAVLPHRDHESTFLRAHFYSNHRPRQPQPPTTLTNPPSSCSATSTHSLIVGIATASHSSTYRSSLSDSGALKALQVLNEGAEV